MFQRKRYIVFLVSSLWYPISPISSTPGFRTEKWSGTDTWQRHRPYKYLTKTPTVQVKKKIVTESFSFSNLHPLRVNKKKRNTNTKNTQDRLFSNVYYTGWKRSKKNKNRKCKDTLHKTQLKTYTKRNSRIRVNKRCIYKSTSLHQLLRKGSLKDR